jgi:hypothetical protein
VLYLSILTRHNAAEILWRKHTATVQILRGGACKSVAEPTSFLPGRAKDLSAPPHITFSYKITMLLSCGLIYDIVQIKTGKQ